MKVYTSYFGNAKTLAKHNVKIVSVARWQPRYLSVPIVMLDVAPEVWMLKNATHEQYVNGYNRILSRVNAHEFMKRLETISGGSDVALCCYEKPGDFCHRHMLADYLTQQTGIEVKEFEVPAPPPPPKKIETPSLFDEL